MTTRPANTPGQVEDVRLAGRLPGRLAVAQAQAVDRVGVGGGEDHLAVGDRGRRYLPTRRRGRRRGLAPRPRGGAAAGPGKVFVLALLRVGLVAVGEAPR